MGASDEDLGATLKSGGEGVCILVVLVFPPRNGGINGKEKGKVGNEGLYEPCIDAPDSALVY